jgi:hypothetical protein
MDLDSDNDGISDIYEAGGKTLDANNDGIIDNFTDSDNDSIPDAVEALAGANSWITPTNTDADAVADYLDLDSDNDGIPDVVEGQATATYSNGNNDGDISDEVS